MAQTPKGQLAGSDISSARADSHRIAAFARALDLVLSTIEDNPGSKEAHGPISEPGTMDTLEVAEFIAYEIGRFSNNLEASIAKMQNAYEPPKEAANG
jgi:hypothetical protein